MMEKRACECRDGRNEKRDWVLSCNTVGIHMKELEGIVNDGSCYIVVQGSIVEVRSSGEV